MNTGAILKKRLELDNKENVKITRYLNNNYPTYLVVYNSRMPNYPITQSYIEKDPHVLKLAVGNKLSKRPVYTPVLDIEDWNGNIRSSFFIVIDLAGKFYVRENKANKNPYNIRLYELSASEWSRDGLSDRNIRFYDIRMKDGNTKIEYKGSKYNRNNGTLTVTLRATPTYLNLESPETGEIEKKVLVINPKTTGTKNSTFYTLQIQFQDINGLVGKKEEWFNLSKKERIEIVRDIIDGSDVKFWANDMSFLYQNSWKLLSDLNSSIYDFPSLPDKGIWYARHGSDFHLTKHLVGGLQILKPNADYIARDITSDFEARKQDI